VRANKRVCAYLHERCYRGCSFHHWIDTHDDVGRISYSSRFSCKGTSTDILSYHTRQVNTSFVWNSG